MKSIPFVASFPASRPASRTFPRFLAETLARFAAQQGLAEEWADEMLDHMEECAAAVKDQYDALSGDEREQILEQITSTEGFALVPAISPLSFDDLRLPYPLPPAPLPPVSFPPFPDFPV